MGEQDVCGKTDEVIVPSGWEKTCRKVNIYHTHQMGEARCSQLDEGVERRRHTRLITIIMEETCRSKHCQEAQGAINMPVKERLKHDQHLADY
jgi:hypothetical protein